MRNLPRGIYKSNSVARPFIAKFGGKYLGSYETVGLALEARDIAELQRPQKRPAVIKKTQTPFRKREIRTVRDSLDDYICYLLSNKRAECRRRCREFSLTLECVMQLWEKQGGKCAMSGDFMSYNHKGRSPLALSIDRIDNACGYTPDNIWLTTVRVNRARGEFSIEEFIGMCCRVSLFSEQKNEPIQ
jgi:hypothetical protein